MPSAPEPPGARIPVFASIPSKLDDKQLASRRYIYGQLASAGLEPRPWGASNRGQYNPLHEVRTRARHCAGGIIFGYTAVSAEPVTSWNELTRSYEPSKDKKRHSFPTPWNQLETGILFGLGLPLFVLKQDDITGGIFDEGASDVLILPMPMPGEDRDQEHPEDLQSPAACRSFEATLSRWQALVRAQYYAIC